MGLVIVLSARVCRHLLFPALLRSQPRSRRRVFRGHVVTYTWVYHALHVPLHIRGGPLSICRCDWSADTRCRGAHHWPAPLGITPAMVTADLRQRRLADFGLAYRSPGRRLQKPGGPLDRDARNK